jgi:hypothetical protein
MKTGGTMDTPTSTLKPGDGATLSVGSDAYPYTIISISASGRKLAVRACQHRCISGSIHTGDAQYEFSECPEAPVETAHLTKKPGVYRLNGCLLYTSHGRRYHMDPHF